MKMKMKLRKSVIFLLFVTVLSPIVLYTDTLEAYFTDSYYRSGFVEDASPFPFSGDVGPLNVLPQESSKALNESKDIVIAEDLIRSGSNYSNSSSGESTRFTRQLTGESLEDQTVNSPSINGTEDNKQFIKENPIRQVTYAVKDLREENPIKIEPVVHVKKRRARNNTRKKSNSQRSDGMPGNVSNKMEIKQRLEVTQPSGKGSGKELENTKSDEKENKPPVILDTRVRQLKDQLIRAKVYISLSGTRNNPQFMREFRLRMKEVQRALGEASKDSELPENADEKMKAMEETLLKGKQLQDDCAAVIKKLRAMLHLAEEQLRVQKKHELFLSHLTAKTMSKGLHCLPLRLSTEYFMINSTQQQFPNKERLDDPKLYHYALFSDNILAAAVVINSTIAHLKDPTKHVFHVVTDRLNFAAMKMWFLAYPPGKATIQVQNVEEFTWLNSSYSPVLKQLGSPSMIDYYFRNRRADPDSNLKFRNPKYLSIMNHLRFYLPEIFPKLDKILFLDDDIVVQKDLSGLWSLDLGGKVIGVVETCGESFHRFDRYLNFSNPVISKNFDPHACGWAFGMNLFDLKEWKKQNITDVYHQWQSLNHDRLLWKLGTLPPGLITFWNHTYALDKSWHVLGLGYDPNIPRKDIERAAVIHYNGNLKPWLEIGIPKFRNYWEKYVDYDNLFLRECNITP